MSVSCEIVLLCLKHVIKVLGIIIIFIFIIGWQDKYVRVFYIRVFLVLTNSGPSPVPASVRAIAFACIL
jgi:hypothetical protein